MEPARETGGAIRWEGTKGGLLLLPGWEGDPAEFKEIGDFLAERGFYVLAPAMPRGAFDGYTFRRAGEMALFDLQAAARPVAVLGVGLGGTLALDLASRYPLRAVVAVFPLLAGATPWQRLRLLVAGRGGREEGRYRQTVRQRLSLIRVPTLLLTGTAGPEAEAAARAVELVRASRREIWRLPATGSRLSAEGETLHRVAEFLRSGSRSGREAGGTDGQPAPPGAEGGRLPR